MTLAMVVIAFILISKKALNFETRQINEESKTLKAFKIQIF